MLSPQTLLTLDDLYQIQNTYVPNAGITAQLQNKALLMFVAATCEGKNTVMKAMTELDSRFTVAGTFTSREPQAGDDPGIYTYIPNTDEGLRDLFSRITAKQVVQYAVNPHARHIYGSTLEDYPGEYNLRDVFASAVSGFEQLSFRRTLAISLVSEPMIWADRFEQRFPHGHPLRTARHGEAIESFTWSLGHPNANHFLVENIEGDASIAARNIIRITDGAVPDSTRARTLIQGSLEAAKKIKP
ncbi:MAG: hypothetical protein WDN27_06325 [Candidatus Saccharibacteria bacterium]